MRWLANKSCFLLGKIWTNTYRQHQNVECVCDVFQLDWKVQTEGWFLLVTLTETEEYLNEEGR